MKDLRITLRQLRKAPGFTTTAVVTLALGIGATTAMFTLVYDVLLKPLPFVQADRLVTIQEKVAEWSNVYPTLPVSANHFTFWQRYSHSFKAMAVMQQYSTPLGFGDRPLQVGVLSATAGLFQVLQVAPQMGRSFDHSEAQPGRDHVAVLTFDLWRNRFGSDRRIIGKTVTLDGYPYTVIGVMPQSFHMPPVSNVATFGDTNRPEPLGVIIPLAFSKEDLAEEMGDLNYFGLGRLKSDVTLPAATADLDALQHTISSNLPANEKSTLSISLRPFQEELTGADQRPLIILLGAVLGLLVVGCVNIANLLLARAVGQRQQMAVASALGASRAEMAWMALRETVFLAGVGSLIGVLLAAIAVPFLQRYLPPALDFRGALHLDWASAGCAFLCCLMATLLAGAAPIVMGSRTAPQTVLRSEAHLASESRETRRVRRFLVGVEVAVSVALVLMTGLMTVSVLKLMHVDRGFNAGQMMTAALDLPRQQYPDRQHCAEFYRELLDKLDHIPGVQHAAITSVLPLTGDSWGDMAQLPGDNRPLTQLPLESFRWITPEYFGTIQLPLLSGRTFTGSDWGKNVAVISSKTAQGLWHGENPVGREFRRAGNPDEKPFTVIGVVADARTISLAKPDPMLIYVPYWFRSRNSAGLVVRAGEDLTSVADSIRRAVRAIDPTVPVPAVRVFGRIVADSIANQRFELQLLLFFATSALLLAALGVYGIVSYSVVQRQREIGLRVALGARPGHVYRLVLRDGLSPVILGTAAGLALAWSAARTAAAMLFGISPHDPSVSIAAASVLVCVGALACLLPARRAASVEPMQVLRAE